MCHPLNRFSVENSIEFCWFDTPRETVTKIIVKWQYFICLSNNSKIKLSVSTENRATKYRNSVWKQWKSRKTDFVTLIYHAKQLLFSIWLRISYCRRMAPVKRIKNAEQKQERPSDRSTHLCIKCFFFSWHKTSLFDLLEHHKFMDFLHYP